MYEASYLSFAEQDKLFNEFISKGVTNLIRANSKVFDQVRKEWGKIDVSGLYAKQKLMLAGSESTGAASTDAYPEPQQSKPGETFVYIKRAQMFSMGFGGFELEAAARKGAEMPPLDFEREGLFIRMSDDLSRQLIGDGSGRLAMAGARTLVPQDPPNGDPTAFMAVSHPNFAKATKFLRPTRWIDIFTADGKTQEGRFPLGAGEQIASVDAPNNRISLVDPSTWTEGSYLYNRNVCVTDEAAGEGEMMGLMGIISDKNPPIPNAALGLQKIDADENPAWKAHVFDNPLGVGGTGRDLIEDLFIQVLDEVEAYATTDVILVSLGVYRAYYALLKTYQRVVNEKKLWGGWSGLVFIYNGREIPIVSDRFVPDGHAFFISNKNLILHVMTPNMIQWERGLGGAGILKQVPGRNSYVAEGHMYMNLATGLRPGFGLLKDINEP